jgi:integrase
LLGTAQRRSDVVRMGPQHIRGHVLYVKQSKTGTELELEILPEVQAALDARPSGHRTFTFIVTESGKPFTAAGFGNWFRDRCNEAGLKGFSSHGLRHTACARLANVGATGHEIGSMVRASELARGLALHPLGGSACFEPGGGDQTSNIAV